VLLPSGSSGPLATGTPPTVTVDLGEAPPVVGFARQASVGLDDGGSKGKGSGSVFFLRIIQIHGGCLYRGKHPACYTRSLRLIRLRFRPIPQGFLVGFRKGINSHSLQFNPNRWSPGKPRLKHGATGWGSTGRHGTGLERCGGRCSASSGMVAHTSGSRGARPGLGRQLGRTAVRWAARQAAREGRATGRLDFGPWPQNNVFHLFKPFIDLQT
jgi:hypothetical protein